MAVLTATLEPPVVYPDTAHPRSNVNLTTATPVEIDTVLAEIYTRYYAACDKATQAYDYLVDTQKYLKATAAGTYRHYFSRYEILRALQREVEQTANHRRLQEEAAEIMRSTAPYNQEFTRRGGWTRAYLVDNTGGHVHNSMSCSTCFPTTRFVWLPEFSGKDEREVVEAAGQQACTVCFPSAPVDVLRRKSTIEAPAKRAARLEREAAKAERDAKKAAKAITTPEGETLRVFDYVSPERQIQGYHGEVVRVIPAKEVFETLSTAHAAKAWLTDVMSGWYKSKRDADIDLVARSLAHKFGTTPEEEISAATKRAQKRR